MATVEIKVIKKIYDFLENSKAKNVIVYGGAGSGKSYTVSQFLILERLLKYKNKHLLVTRKYNPSLRITAWRLIKEMLNAMSIQYEERKSEQIIKLPNGSEILFRGMDDPEKIKSAEFNYIWMEEATEFTLEDYQQLRLRLRRATAGQRNQMYLTFNPVGKTNWVYKYFFQEEQPDTQILHTNYKDNPFLDKEYVQALLELEKQDKAFYKIYTLGEFAELENVIYTNYRIVNEIPKEFDEVIYGLDFGYNNPTALIKIGIKDGEYWILEELYETKLTNADLIERMKAKGISRNNCIYADSAEPNRIEELNRAGFNVLPAEKSVKDGIDFVKRQRLYIYEKCTNTIKEIQNYKWKEDKDGNVLDEPVKFMDHSLDAIRYAMYTHNKRYNNQINIRFI